MNTNILTIISVIGAIVFAVLLAISFTTTRNIKHQIRCKEAGGWMLETHCIKDNQELIFKDEP